MKRALGIDESVAQLTAVASAQRFRIIAELAAQPTHVSELARRVGMSRALLYMHLQRLEESGFLTGHFEMTDDGKALKVFEVVPFSITVNVASIRAAVAVDAARFTAAQAVAAESHEHEQESEN